jgi:dolichol-phosphate mannosyltransferase
LNVGTVATTPAPAWLRYSVVVPVFHEAANIGPFCAAVKASFPPGYELLVCYDVADDSTIPVLAMLPEDARPPRIRLVHNTLGRGVRWAIESGMRAARAPVVLVTMVDLSDDYRIVERMLSDAEAGAAVVCASRYVRGGEQIGGPRLKAALSRIAGMTLHWFAGLPTHDPTNSFKAYRRDFLETTPIESPAGFALALELTVKAHFSGRRVTEIPATWRDRTAGESRFRIWAWLPLYLRWYVTALRWRWLGAPATALGDASDVDNSE